MLNVKLGKAPKKIDHRTLKLGKYMDTSTLPALPTSLVWSDKVIDYGMLANDSIGDCTIAGALHQIMSWAADNSATFSPTDQDAISIYSAVTGYDPNNPATDRGAAEIDVLNYWRKNGMLGHQIGAYAEIDITRLDLVKYAIDLFGGSYIGVQLPLTANGATEWDVPSGGTSGNGAPGSWGGHAVIILDYDDDAQQFTVITWGQPLKMSYAFFSAYAEEAYAILSSDFVTGSAPSPNGFDLATLQADLQAL